MERIIDNSSSGKTRKLMVLAKQNNGIFVCECPERMKQKALAYEILGLSIVSYQDISLYADKKLYIDDLEKFLKQTYRGVSGYCITTE